MTVPVVSMGSWSGISGSGDSKFVNLPVSILFNATTMESFHFSIT